MMTPESSATSFTEHSQRDNCAIHLAREVYVVCGVPIDAVSKDSVLQAIYLAAEKRIPFWISTVNLNYLIRSQADPQFMASLLTSDLCTVDGMPVLWLARLLGIPLRGRTAGSDLFDAIRSSSRIPPIRAFLFGGPAGAAEVAAQNINATSSGMTCVGSLNPGFGTVEEMSSQFHLKSINDSGADLLAVSLGAQKGQAWLLHNHHAIRVPVRAHLGATINFEAGTVKRAPKSFRAFGIEWIWRILEEPYLWRRYWSDALGLAKLMGNRVIPLLAIRFWDRCRKLNSGELLIRISNEADSVSITLSGPAIAANLPALLPHLNAAVNEFKHVRINCAGITTLDARFLGLLLMLKKELNARGRAISVVELTSHLRRRFHLNGFENLADDGIREYA